MKTLIINGRMPGLNEILGATNANRYKGAKLKKQWIDLVYWECLRQKVGKAIEPVYIEFAWFEPSKRRDPDNFTSAGRKLILDGLQKAGVLKNDGWKNIGGFTDKWYVDKKNPQVIVTIKEGM